MICPKTPESRQKILEQNCCVTRQILTITFSRRRGGREITKKDFPRKDIQRRNTRKASNEKEIYGVNKKILHDLTLEKYPRYGAKKKLAHTLSPSQANVYFRRLGLREKIVKPVFSIC